MLALSPPELEPEEAALSGRGTGEAAAGSRVARSVCSRRGRDSVALVELLGAGEGCVRAGTVSRLAGTGAELSVLGVSRDELSAESFFVEDAVLGVEEEGVVLLRRGLLAGSGLFSSTISGPTSRASSRDSGSPTIVLEEEAFDADDDPGFVRRGLLFRARSVSSEKEGRLSLPCSEGSTLTSTLGSAPFHSVARVVAELPPLSDEDACDGSVCSSPKSWELRTYFPNA